jgi:hypothetical protein
MKDLIKSEHINFSGERDNFRFTFIKHHRPQNRTLRNIIWQNGDDRLSRKTFHFKIMQNMLMNDESKYVTESNGNGNRPITTNRGFAVFFKDCKND